MQFQVNGKDYFLAFVEDEGRWYVFAPTASAIERRSPRAATVIESDFLILGATERTREGKQLKFLGSEPGRAWVFPYPA